MVFKTLLIIFGFACVHSIDLINEVSLGKIELGPSSAFRSSFHACPPCPVCPQTAVGSEEESTEENAPNKPPTGELGPENKDSTEENGPKDDEATTEEEDSTEDPGDKDGEGSKEEEDSTEDLGLKDGEGSKEDIGSKEERPDDKGSKDESDESSEEEPSEEPNHDDEENPDGLIDYSGADSSSEEDSGSEDDDTDAVTDQYDEDQDNESGGDDEDFPDFDTVLEPPDDGTTDRRIITAESIEDGNDAYEDLFPNEEYVYDDANITEKIKDDLFSERLYKTVNKEFLFHNFVVSPLSARFETTLVLIGSSGPNRAQLAQVLQLPDDDKQLKKSIKQLQRAVKKSKLELETLVLIDRTFKVVKLFRLVAKFRFGAKIYKVDFEEKTLANAINAFVEQHTHKRIRKFVFPKRLEPQLKLILFSLLKLKGTWPMSFRGDSMRFQTNRNRRQVSVKSISGGAIVDFVQNEHGKFLQLPLAMPSMFVTFVLPNAASVEAFEYLESNLEQVISTRSFSKERVEIELPQFHITTKLDFTDILKEWNATLAFDKSQDWANANPNADLLAVSDMIYVTSICVNERGIGVISGKDTHFLKKRSPESGRLEPKLRSGRGETQTEFRANRPFIFYVTVSNHIVAIGRVLDPTHVQVHNYMI